MPTDFPGPHPDTRCCGDHPGDWEHPAEPGHSFCQECLDRLDVTTRMAGAQ